MANKFTEGPWKVRKEWHGDGKEVYPDRKVSVGQPSELCVVSGIYEECAANTRLIAAAPDLLEALQDIHAWLVCAAIANNDDMAQSFPHMEAVARKALDKATGVPQ
jgi:hypothetical protein